MATDIEYPDVETAGLPEAYEAAEPLHLRNLQFQEYWDLTLEEAIAIALHNSKVIRSIAQVQQFGFSATGAARLRGASTIYDPALSETLATPTPHQVDGTGNRVLPRGAARANAVGGVADALSEFDTQFFSSLTYNLVDRATNNNVVNAAGARNTNFLMSLSKRAATGGVWTVRHTIANSWSTNNLAVPSDWTAALELEVNHPLLRGRGTQINRIPVILARIRTDITLADFQRNVRDLVADVERTYWDLQCAYRIVEANEQGRDAAHAAWRKDRVLSGATVGGEQEPRAAEQYLRFRSQVEASLASRTQGEGVFVLERRLRALLGLTPTDRRLIRPIDEASTTFVTFDWREVCLESLFRSPELRQQKWFIKQREMELISARNQLLPDLNMGMNYRWIGVGDKLIDANRRGLNFPTPGSTAFDELTEGNFAEAFFSLSFLPNTIGARRQQALVRNAMLEVKKAKAILETMENNVVHELSDAVADLNNQYMLAQLGYSRWVKANQEVRKLEAQFNVQPNLHNQLMDAFDRRARARIEYYQRLCDFNQAVAQVHYFKGTLMDYNGIQLAEGPWPKKAYWDALGRARERDASHYFDYGATRPRVISRGPAPHQAAPHHADRRSDPGRRRRDHRAKRFRRAAEDGWEPLPAPREPADNGESEEMVPEARRSGPDLNAPTRAEVRSDAVQPAAHQSPVANAFQWGGMSLDR